MITRNDKVVAEQWLESLPSIDKAHYVKLLQLDASVGKDIVKCALEYKFKYEERKYLDHLSTLPYSELKREYFKPGMSGWFQWLKFKSEAYYRENKDVCDAMIARAEKDNHYHEVEQATKRGMESAINNANFDKKYGPSVFGGNTTGAWRR